MTPPRWALALLACAGGTLAACSSTPSTPKHVTTTTADDGSDHDDYDVHDHDRVHHHDHDVCGLDRLQPHHGVGGPGRRGRRGPSPG